MSVLAPLKMASFGAKSTCRSGVGDMQHLSKFALIKNWQTFFQNKIFVKMKWRIFLKKKKKKNSSFLEWLEILFVFIK